MFDKNLANMNVIDEDSMDSISYIFPDNVTPFVNQVAGHEFTKAKPTIGMMKHSDGYVLKPVPHPVYGPREINFYKTLETTCDPLLKDLKQYIPQYLGTTSIELDNKDVRCICMEDITKDFKLPCVMDVKIGVQTWEPNATEEKIKVERVKYAACKKRWGFSIPGFQYYNVRDGSFIRRGKDFGKRMSAQEAIQALYSFINAEAGIKYGLVASILEQLRKIHSWFRHQRHFLFFSSSILFAYDAENVKILINEGESWGNGEAVHNEQDSKINVCMIDFAHVLPNLEHKVDVNYLTSLEKLIHVFENLSDLYALNS
ncbi:hypothetical protein PGB90_010182 [Kerria lacca]